MTYITVKLFILVVFNTATGSIAVDSGPGPGYTLAECRSAARQTKNGTPSAWRAGIKIRCRQFKTLKQPILIPVQSPAPITWPGQ